MVDFGDQKSHNKIMISVVIPAYNEEKYIENCLKSLLSQEEMPDEIIVVDNNSTDQTSKIVKKYPVTLISEKKKSNSKLVQQIWGLAEHGRLDEAAKAAEGSEDSVATVLREGLLHRDTSLTDAMMEAASSDLKLSGAHC